MKVLHITNAYPTEKYPTYGVFIKEQVQSLVKNGVLCEILFVNGREKGYLAYLKSIYKLRRISKKFDLIHCHHAYSAYTFVLSCVKKPFIVSFLSPKNWEVKKGIIHRYFYSQILKKCAGFIVKDDPTINTRNAKGYYLPNGVDLDFFKPIEKKNAFNHIAIVPATYILFVSNGDGIKRPEKRYSLFKATVELVNKKYNLNAVELILTNVERSKVPYYFNAASVHLLTSDVEGSPNSVKESLACNIPVVSTDVGNVKELISSVTGCYISPVNDSDILSDLVYKAIQLSSIKGRESLINNKLDMDSVSHRLISIYKKILDKKLFSEKK